MLLKPCIADSIVIALKIFWRLRRLLFQVKLQHLHRQREKADPSNSLQLVVLSSIIREALGYIIDCIVEFGHIANLTAPFLVGPLRIRDEKSKLTLYLLIKL